MNTQIKKAYTQIVELLEANSNKKVSTIMPQILELVTAKVASKTFATDEAGEVVAVYCYYHKCWENVANVPYGKKASTASGLNTMCKEGVSHWTKQQRKAKLAKEALLGKVASGELEASELADELEAIEVERLIIVHQTDELGFDTAEEAIG